MRNIFTAIKFKHQNCYFNKKGTVYKEDYIFPKLLVSLGNDITVFTWTGTAGSSSSGDLFPMLICAGDEYNFFSYKPLPNT